MSSETLEDEKLPTEGNRSQLEKEAAEPQAEDNSEKEDVDDKGQEEGNQVEDKKEEDADDEVEVEEEEEEDDEEEEVEERAKVKSRNESDPATPASERPTRERKTVDRYTVSSPSKFPRSSASKPLSIEKGNGTQLKDIPNVAFKLSKRKADDNLRTLHSILFGKKAKARNLKRNIGLFSGYVWAENEEKQRAKIRERIDKCVKEKLVDLCDVLNIPINKSGVKKEEMSAKLLEFLESPHATTDVLLADKEKKGKKRSRKEAPSKSSSKKQKKTSQVGKKQKPSSDIEEDDRAEPLDEEVDSQDDDVSVPKSESDNEESISEKEEERQRPQKRTSKKTVKEDQTTPVKKTTTAKTSKSNEKTPQKSTSKKVVTDNTSEPKQSVSKKQKTVRENQDSKGKFANKKQTDKSSKASVKDQDKGKSSEKAKAVPSREDMHRVVVDILKEADFNTATLSDILRQLGTHFGVDLMHRKAEVKDIITDVINNMSDDGEEAENDGDNGADKDDA